MAAGTGCADHLPAQNSSQQVRHRVQACLGWKVIMNPISILKSASLMGAAGTVLFLSTAPLGAYTLPVLPPIPSVSPAAANSIPMGNPANFPETNMDFAIETNGPFLPTWTSISANVPGNGTPAWMRQAKFGIWLHYGPQA